MAQRSHVPKFGNWESENIPYTTYFENARKDKGAPTKTFNPNDPEENPDAFMPGALTPGREFRKQFEADDSRDYGIHNAVSSSFKNMHQDSEDSSFQGYTGAPVSHKVKSDPQSNRPQSNRKSSNSESGTDKSSSDNSLPPYQHRSRPSKFSAEGRRGFSPSPPRPRGFSPSPPRQAILRPGNPQQAESQRRVVSVPKFGAWDETDPKSAESFTVIFSRVKEEKQIAATKLPTVPTEQTIYPDQQRNRSSASPVSKILCCLFPSSSK